jgi:hypothetical protein
MSEEKTANKTVVLPDPDTASGDVETQGFDAKATKKLLRKLDWHIIPFMSLIYLYTSTHAINQAHGQSNPFADYVFSTEPTSETRASIT